MLMFLKRILVRFRLKKEQEDFNTVSANIESGVSFRGTNLWILMFAIFIASLGLNVNSTAVIIGAMLISPLMGPIMGMGYSLAVNDLSMLKRSWSSYIYATGVSLFTSTIYFTISPLNDAHSEILARTSPNIYDVLIAFFGGLAGMMATTSRLKGNVLPGVAIATALMPPLCTAGYGIATLEMSYFFGAIYLFLINSVFIALASLITARFLKIPYKHLPHAGAEKKARRVIIAITLITVLPSIYFGYDMILQNRQLKQATDFVKYETVFPNDFLLRHEIDTDKKKISLTFGGSQLTDDEISELKAKLERYSLKGFELEVRQGFTSLQSNGVAQMSQLALTISEKDRELEFLRSRIDSMIRHQDMSSQIYRELKAQYPEVAAVSIHRAVAVSDTSDSVFWMAVLDFREGPQDSIARQRINNWLKARLDTDSVRVIY
jgi:uncharacterized hydrophobic protein (TIGR00271 family)